MRRLSSFILIILIIGQGISLSAQTKPTTRALSLKVLQSRLQQSLSRGERPADLMTLCGITKVDGYVVDEPNRDLILLGQVDPTTPALHIEDLAVALRNVWMRYATRQGNTLIYHNPGCSIDPDPQVIQRLAQIGAATRSAPMAAMDSQMQAWCDACELPQKVRVLGIPYDTHFAKVMVDADYLMKRLVDGSLNPEIPGFSSLIDRALAASNEREIIAGMNRFWFYPGKASFPEQDGVVIIEQCPVMLLTEEEHLTQEGIKGQGRPDPLAQAFARDFTAHYADIAAKQPIYQELEGLFRFVAIAKLIRYQQAKVNLDYLVKRFPVPEVKLTRTLPGISQVKYVERRQDLTDGYEIRKLWLPSCGGVSMDFKIDKSNFKKVTSKRTGDKKMKSVQKSSILKSRPAPDALYWDIGKL